MWFDNIEEGYNWSSLWYRYIRCTCGGIRTFEEACPVCGVLIQEEEWTYDQNETEHRVPQAYMGAEESYEDYIYLQMLEIEWARPITDKERFLDIAESSRPSARAVIVIIFWTYFERRIEHLFRENMRSLPDGIREELLRRYSSIGSRLDRLYKVLFSSTYWGDLELLGYTNISLLLQRIQKSRNQFSHGHPEAINDKLINDLLMNLKDEHESWIAVFNYHILQGRAQ